MAEKKVKTSAGKETASQTVARIKSALGQSNKSSSGGSSRPNESVEQTVARANAMLAQTKAEGSKPFAGSSYEKTYLASIPAQMKNESVANIPTPPVTPNYGDVTGTNMQGMLSIMEPGTTYDTKTGYVPPPQTQDNLKSLFDQANLLQNQAFQDMGTDEARLAKLEKDNQLKQKQNAVNEYTAQLNSIVAKQQQDLLRVEGQGRGIPDVIIGGQQAQINKEAAIAALPVQAQLAAAQGALEMAQAHIDKMFQIQSNDALAKYNYTSKLIDSVYQFATGAEQRRLDAIKDKEDRAYDMQKTDMAYQRDLAAQALEYGQSSLMGKILKLDKNSPTYSTDLANLASQLVKPVSTVTPKRDTQFDKDGNLVDMQTGEVIKAGTSTDTGAITTLSGKPQTEGQAKANGFADRLLEAERVLQNSDKFANLTAIGGVLPNFLKTEDRQEFEQAQRNYINAVLRRESGAVISDQEFDNARQQYFPQIGDSEGVLAQKAANRNTVINSFYREANVLRPVGPGDIVESGGKRYKVDDDGVTLIEI